MNTGDHRKRIARVIDQIRPVARSDGGDIELVDVDPLGVVRVRLLGACAGCPSSHVTLKEGVERALREQVPEVREVVCV